MFENATRNKLRFETIKGQLSVEDLWDLPLMSSAGRVNLDDIARSLHKQLKNDDDVSFVVTAKKSDATVQLKFDIVKHIIDVKMAENKAAAEEHNRADKKQKLLAIIADRENEALKNMPLDELRKALADL